MVWNGMRRVMLEAGDLNRLIAVEGEDEDVVLCLLSEPSPFGLWQFAWFTNLGSSVSPIKCVILCLRTLPACV
jgi:hypothetical protein